MLTLGEDSELLRTVSALLRENGYDIRWANVADQSARLLLAENSLFVVGVAATATVADLLEVHALVATELVELVRLRDPGAKQWDVYLVLLTMEDVPEDRMAFQELTEINYDTRGLRRIARAGVTPDVESIGNALRTFLPLPTGVDGGDLRDPLDELREEISSRGIAPPDADRAVSVFRSTRSLLDA